MKKLLLIALIFVSGGAMAQNVGIGTANPDESAILDLKSSNKGFLLPRLTEKQKTLIPQPAEGLMIYQTDASQGVYLYQGGNWKNMGSANVTTSTISGATANAVGPYTANYLLAGDGTSSPMSTSVYVNPSNGNVGIGTATVPFKFNITSGSNKGWIDFISGGIAIGSTGALGLFSNNTERIRITNTGGIGIGTSAVFESAIMEIFSTTKGILLPRMTETQKLAIVNPIDGLMVYQSNNTKGLNVYQNGSWQDLNKFNNQFSALSANYLITSNGTNLLNTGLYVNPTNGNLGFGTSSPEYKFTFVSGQNKGYIDFVPSGIAFGSPGAMGLYSNNTERIRIAQDGNVGIGNGAPSEKLDVSGSIQQNAVKSSVLKTDANGKLVAAIAGTDYLAPGSSAFIQGTGTINYLPKFSATGTVSNSVIAETSTNIGIGTATPSQKLDVAGSIQQSAVTSSVLKADGTGKLIAATAGTDFVTSGTNTVGTIAKFSASGTVANSALTEAAITNGTGVKLDSKSAGYLAVGDFGAGSPMSIPTGYRLVVQDGIITEKVKVAVRNQTDWADYVFEPNYSLMPLNEVEQFVKENKHLPNVPSADQMVEQGVEVGKTSKMFMEKIEELTLYLIELKKEIEALKAENAKLKK